MAVHQVLIGGEWRESRSTGTFRAENPRTREPLADEFPISGWLECDETLRQAAAAAVELRQLPAEALARFLERYAERIEGCKQELVEIAHTETALPKAPRLADVELPRTTSQLRQAAAAARSASWSLPTIDTAAGIRSVLGPLGPICVFGPNNFPFAFGSISGGDFAAAIAAGNPVIAKANSSHPGTTRRFAVEANLAAGECELPAGTVQLIYRTSHDDGERLVADPRVGGTGYTGSRHAGLRLKAAADRAGKPIYLELSSVNPVVILPGALSERGEELAQQFSASCLMGTGQFCTNPGLVLLLSGTETTTFVERISAQFESAPVGTLLSKSVEQNLARGVRGLIDAGAEVLVGNSVGGGQGYSYANTLLAASARQFLRHAAELQAEAFGNAALIVIADTVDELTAVIDHLEGNLTGCVYSATQGGDDLIYDKVAFHLRPKVGRLLNDKMPTGVAVSAAMNHGGPFPATGHPGFTAVGIPASLRRFAMLQCYDGVRTHRLPPVLRDKNPNGTTWRFINGAWTQADVA
jgi:NADP-dependent aldehyde dehydrogenase